jgi:hypothetical protein
MAGAQRLGGEIDAAYATLQHAFALGLAIYYRNRSDVEFLPFLGGARFQALRAKSEADVAEQRRQIAQSAGIRRGRASEVSGEVRDPAQQLAHHRRVLSDIQGDDADRRAAARSSADCNLTPAISR